MKSTIMEHIFGFLHHSAAGAACSNWRHALFIRELKRRNQMHFAKECLSDRLPPAKYLLKYQGLCRNYYLDEVTFGQIKDLTGYIGQSAVEITFNNVAIGDKQFYAFMRLITHLVSFELSHAVHRYLCPQNLAKLSIKHEFYNSQAANMLPTEENGHFPNKGCTYMASEIFTKANKDGHGRAVDIWSVGCVVVEMASGKYNERELT
uniref:Protein kinase domain-containing protein n=1 Tax=Glossina pallidipes TaxID=7398 RepID=A0A1A9Z5D5_GLOPL